MTPPVLANELLTADATRVADLLIKQEVTWNSNLISDSDRDQICGAFLEDFMENLGLN